MMTIEESIIDELIMRDEVMDLEVNKLNDDLSIVKNKLKSSKDEIKNLEKINEELKAKIKSTEVELVKEKDIKILDNNNKFDLTKFPKTNKVKCLFNNRICLLQGYKINKELMFKII